MDIAMFRGSLDGSAPPSGISLPLQALWWDAKGDWDKAHRCAQDDPTLAGSAVHAYLHRKEPDLGNARYWYNRAGREPARGSLEQEWETMAEEFLNR